MSQNAPIEQSWRAAAEVRDLGVPLADQWETLRAYQARAAKACLTSHITGKTSYTPPSTGAVGESLGRSRSCDLPGSPSYRGVRLDLLAAFDWLDRTEAAHRCQR